tara:strand:+ start:492 stop:869 length:378 start_codon:yes stop_codon:yes gene_type:complete
MPTFVNRAYMSTTTTGAGTIDLDGGAVSGYQTFAAAGLTSGDTVSYTILDGSTWECGTGEYTDAATDTLSRVLVESSSGSLLVLSGSATVFVTALAADFNKNVDGGSPTSVYLADGSQSIDGGAP